MEMKYIVVQGHHEDAGDVEVPLIFPYVVVHKDMADVFYRNRDIRMQKVVAAGFVYWDKQGQAVCHGMSESLNIKSRPEQDAKLINGLQLNWSCTRVQANVRA